MNSMASRLGIHTPHPNDQLFQMDETLYPCRMIIEYFDSYWRNFPNVHLDSPQATCYNKKNIKKNDFILPCIKKIP